MNSERIQVVDIREGDTVFLHAPMLLNKDQRFAMQKWAEDRFPENKVVMLEHGIEVSVARPNANELLERVAKAVEKMAAQFDQVSGGGNSFLTEKA